MRLVSAILRSWRSSSINATRRSIRAGMINVPRLDPLPRWRDILSGAALFVRHLQTYCLRLNNSVKVLCETQGTRVKEVASWDERFGGGVRNGSRLYLWAPICIFVYSMKSGLSRRAVLCEGHSQNMAGLDYERVQHEHSNAYFDLTTSTWSNPSGCSSNINS